MQHGQAVVIDTVEAATDAAQTAKDPAQQRAEAATPNDWATPND